MNAPAAISRDTAGHLYVADQDNHRIQKFDASGNWLRAWGGGVNGGSAFGICTTAADCHAGSTGGLGGEMNTPLGVATDSAGNAYVADTNNNRIQKFDSSGNWLRAWGKGVNGGGGFEVCTTAASCKVGATGGLGGEMNGPFFVATDAADNIYVADTYNHRVQVFDTSGNWLRAWGKGVNGGPAFGVCTTAASCQAGSVGGLGGELNSPRGLGTDAADNVYVADTYNHRIQKFDTSGNWLRAWGKGVDGGTAFGVCTTAANCHAGSGGGLGGELNFPRGMSTGAGSDVYVADYSNNRIQKFDSSGTWARAWGKGVNGGTDFGVCTTAASCQTGTTGGLGGEMNNPRGVVTDAEGDLYVADQDNHRIQRFADPPPPAPGISSPTEGESDAGAGTSGASVPVHATGVAGGTLTVSEGTTTLATLPIDGSGHADASVQLPYGSHTLSFTQTSGGKSSTAVVRHVTVSPAAPTVASPTEGESDTGTGASGASVPIHATGVPGSTLTVSEGTTTLATLPIDGSGHADGTVQVPYGSHTLSFTQTAGGQTSSPVLRHLTAAPAAPNIASPTENQTFIASVPSGASVPIHATGVPGSTLTVSEGTTTLATLAIDGSGHADGTVQVPYGSHTLSFTQTSGGKSSTAVARHVTVSPAAPTAFSPTGSSSSGTVFPGGNTTGSAQRQKGCVKKSARGAKRKSKRRGKAKACAKKKPAKKHKKAKKHRKRR